MKLIDVYYTGVDERYGYIIEERKTKGHRGILNNIIKSGSGESNSSQMALLNASNEVLKSLEEILKSESYCNESVAITYFYPDYFAARYTVRKMTSVDNLISLNQEEKNMIKEIKINREKLSILSNISQTNNSCVKKESGDGPSQVKHDIIKYALINDVFSDIENINKKPPQDIKLIIKDMDGSKVVLTKEEKKELANKRKREKKELLALERAKRQAYRNTEEYKNFIISLVDKEISTERVLNTSQVSIQQEYNLEEIEDLLIYTDGSSKGVDNKNNSSHGYGVVILDKTTGRQLFKFKGRFSDDSKAIVNIQLVELYAIYRALVFIDNKMKEGIINPKTKIEIRTDSNDCVENLAKHKSGKGKNNGYHYYSKNLLDEVLKLTEEKNFKLSWVKGHAKDENNKEVDRLARSGTILKTLEEYMLLNTVNNNANKNIIDVYLVNNKNHAGLFIKSGKDIIEAVKIDLGVNNEYLSGVVLVEAFNVINKHIVRGNISDKPLVKLYAERDDIVDYVLVNKKSHSISDDKNIRNLLDACKSERIRVSRKQNIAVSKKTKMEDEHKDILKQISYILNDKSIPSKDILESCADLNDSKEYGANLKKGVMYLREKVSNVININDVIEEMNELMEATNHIKAPKRLTM